MHVFVYQAVDTVQQTITIVQEEEKKAFVMDFIRNMLPQDKAIIFVGKKIKWVQKLFVAPHTPPNC